MKKKKTFGGQLKIMVNSTGVHQVTHGKRSPVIITLQIDSSYVFTVIVVHVHDKFKAPELKNLVRLLGVIRSSRTYEPSPVQSLIMMGDFNLNMHLPIDETAKVQSQVEQVCFFFCYHSVCCCFVV